MEVPPFLAHACPLDFAKNPRDRSGAVIAKERVQAIRACTTVIKIYNTISETRSTQKTHPKRSSLDAGP